MQARVEQYICHFTKQRMDIRIFKFGGASISSQERIRNMGKIIERTMNGQGPNDRLMLVISAMGKTTNALEKVADAFFQKNRTAALQLFDEVKQQHLTLAKQLLATHHDECLDQLNNIITEAEWMLHDDPVRSYDHYYDQIVCLGELLSTIIIAAYLNESGIGTTWLDVRDIIRTDNNFRDANIDLELTGKNVANLIDDHWNETGTKAGVLLTQGFVGSTMENESTTLGREGSDYTAAIFANMMDAKSMTIWKDVESVMNADPKQFKDAVPIAALNYEEVIEMAYYGAQVIHPKTIKPLYQKKIPLYVKCFLDDSLPGTVIDDRAIKGLPPIIVLKEQQVLIHFHSKDFSFVGERPVGQLYHLFEEMSIRPSLTQNGAITFLCCVDDKEDKLQKLAFAADAIFDIRMEKGLTLLTIRHYDDALVDQLIGEREVVLKQQAGRDTIQVLLR